VVVLVTSAQFTLGTSLAAPFAIFAARRFARRRGRPFTRLFSWLSAVTGSSVAILLAFLIALSLIAPSTFRQTQDAAAAAQDTAKLPEWVTRVFPQAGRPDPVTREIVNSPPFTVFFGALGLVIGCAFLGAIAGSAGWFGVTLLGYGLRGKRAV